MTKKRSAQHRLLEVSVRIVARALVCTLFAGTAFAAEPDCGAELLARGQVTAILDGRTLRQGDGPDIRLAGIDVPHDEMARGTLSDLVLGKNIIVRGAPNAPDRYGRLVGFVSLDTATAQIRVQYSLLEGGAARVSGTALNSGCASAFFAREKKARRDKLGLWNNPVYDIRRAEIPDAVMADRGRFTIMQGRVLSVRESAGTIYVNFGRRWSEDVTVTISKRNERSFVAGNMEPKKLSGHIVRVRGFVEERGGPWIEALKPEQIEIVD